MQRFKLFLFRFFKTIHLLPDTLIEIDDLEKNNGCGLDKQLDEYRELIESIERETGYFSARHHFYSVNHAKALDDYLSYLYKLRYPTPCITHRLRPKPTFYYRRHPIKE